jgi:hypothetical protein
MRTSRTERRTKIQRMCKESRKTARAATKPERIPYRCDLYIVALVHFLSALLRESRHVGRECGRSCM